MIPHMSLALSLSKGASTLLACLLLLATLARAKSRRARGSKPIGVKLTII